MSQTKRDYEQHQQWEQEQEQAERSYTEAERLAIAAYILLQNDIVKQ